MEGLARYNERAKKLRHNKAYYFAFLDMLSNERTKGEIKGNTPEQYTNKAINFLEYFDKQGIELEKITKDDIYKYTEVNNKKIGSVFRSALKRLFAVVENPLVTAQEINTLKSAKSFSRKAPP